MHVSEGIGSKVAGSKRALSWHRFSLVTLALILALTIVGCNKVEPADDGGDKPVPVEVTEVILASTTSTQDSGLFDELIPAFEKAHPEYAVKVIAVGTGEALKLGETKDADVLLVHAKAREEAFIENGFGIERRDVMYNDFVIVGPKEDVAGVKAAADFAAAMKAIEKAGASGKTSFVSRGDDSGTHTKELSLWKAAEIATPTPEANKWYESTGQGMGETLKITSEKNVYTMTDRATYLSMKEALDIEILREGDKSLLNQYGVIVVAQADNQQGAQAFFDWVLSPEAQKLIGEFGVEKYGEPLFTPNAS
ncbi:MAG: extracellular solute-binding protein [Coriobacteriia bacterium]|nr:extracellular solute-binding protein [Coriobacteriia bacterium]